MRYTKSEIGFVGAVSLVCLALGLHHLGAKSFWIDEGVTALTATGSISDFARGVRFEPNFGLYYALVRVVSLVGTSEGVLRFPSVLSAVLTVPVVYAIARRLFDKRTAAVAAVLVVLNSYFISWAQEARPYAAVAFLSALATLLLLRALDRQSSSRWAQWLAVCTLTVITHPLGAFVFTAHALALFVLRARVEWRKLGRLAVVPAVVLAVFAVGLAKSGTSRISWIPSLSMPIVNDSMRALFGPSLLVLGIYTIGMVVALFTARTRESALLPAPWPTLFVACWLVSPIALTALVSLVKPLFITRYMIVAIPPAAILAAAGLARLRVPVTAALMLVLVVVAAPAALDPVGDHHDQDWRAAARIVAEHATPDGEVVVRSSNSAFAFYRRDHDQDDDRDVIPVTEFNRLQAASATPCRFSHVWVISRTPEPGAAPDLADAYVTSAMWHVTGLDVELRTRAVDCH